MAYLRLGLSQAELRGRYLEEAPGLLEAELVALFGRRPSRFLDEEVDEERGTLTYYEIKSCLLRDQAGREYQPYGQQQPRWAYVRLPRAITLKERRRDREPVPFDQLLQFPRPGDHLVLDVIGARKQPSPTFEASVVSLPDRHRVASGIVELSIDVPLVRDLPDSTVGRRKETQEVLRARARLGLETDAPEDDERYQRSARVLDREPPPPPREPKRRALAAPRAAKAHSAYKRKK